MRWNHYISYFFGGAFFANAIPHFVSGIMGHPFQSPFATPPGEGLSSATVNVLWGAFNFAVAYLLLCRVGDFELRRTSNVLTAGDWRLVHGRAAGARVRPLLWGPIGRRLQRAR